MRYLCILILIFTLSSCEYFNVKKTSSEAILNEELEAFNWDDVDSYPAFSSCDNLESKEEKKQCFEDDLTTHIYSHLEAEKIVVTQDIHDTIILKFQISEKGDISLLSSKIDTTTTQEIPNIKDLLNNSLEALPEIFPAIKRGQHVKTEFELPLIITVN